MKVIRNRPAHLTESNRGAKYKRGDKVIYGGKPTEVMDVEYDEQYGYDLLVVNPNYDGSDSRYEYIWVGENVDPIEE
jgi:hypothetical protein